MSLSILLVAATLFCVSEFVNTSAPVSEIIELSDMQGESLSAGGHNTGSDISTGSHRHRRHHHIARRRGISAFFFGTRLPDEVRSVISYPLRLKIGYRRAVVRSVRPFYYTFLYRYTLF